MTYVKITFLPCSPFFSLVVVVVNSCISLNLNMSTNAFLSADSIKKILIHSLIFLQKRTEQLRLQTKAGLAVL